MARAFGDYLADVRSHRFPAPEHTLGMEDEAFRELLASLETQAL